MNRNPEPRAASAESARARGLRLGSLFGIELRVDWSLLLIFTLIVVNLGAGLFPRWHPEWTLATSWLVAFVAALLFFASVLAHELSHALVARTQDIPVRRITLFLFGGMAHMESEPKRPMAEFLMAIVGPITSIVIGVTASVLGAWLAGPALAEAAVIGPDETARVLARLGPATTLLLWLGPVNVVLGLFNMIPGFPLDGGRVLRATLWGITGDFQKATRWAALGGQAVGWALAAWGLLQIFSGALAAGLWTMLIGWFLNNAARASVRDVFVREAIREVPVTQVMRTMLDRVVPEMPLDVFVRDHLMRTDQLAFPVEEGGVLVGLVCLDDVRKVPVPDWPTASVRDVMTPAEQLSTLPANADAERAFEELSRRDVDQLPVLDEGRHLLGLVRRRDLLRFISFTTQDALRGRA